MFGDGFVKKRYICNIDNICVLQTVDFQCFKFKNNVFMNIKTQGDNNITIQGDNNSITIQNNHKTDYYDKSDGSIRKLIKDNGDKLNEIHQALLSYNSKTSIQYANKILDAAKEDNVKILDFNGAEVIHTKNVFIYNILSLRSLLLVLAVVFLGVCGYVYSPDIKHYFGFDKIFSKNDKKFKILVLPFQKLGNTDIAVGETIQKKLQEINIKDTLNIDVRYLSDNKQFDFSNEKAEEYMYHHDADFVIYGSYEDKERTKEGKDNFSINYQMHYKYFPLFTLKQPIDEKTIKNLDFAKNFQSGYLEDIRNGKLIGNIEYIVNYISALTDYAGKKYQKAQRKCEKIIMDLGYETYDVWNLMGNLCLEMDMNKFALVSFIKTTHLDSTRMENYFNRGVCFLRLKLYEAAKDDFTQAMADSTLAPEAELNRAVAYMLLGDFEKASLYIREDRYKNLRKEKELKGYLFIGLFGMFYEYYQEFSLTTLKEGILAQKNLLNSYLDSANIVPMAKKMIEKKYKHILEDTLYVNIANNLIGIVEELNNRKNSVLAPYNQKLKENPKDSFNLLVQMAKSLSDSGSPHSAMRCYDKASRVDETKRLFCTDKIIEIALNHYKIEAAKRVALVKDNYEREKLNHNDIVIYDKCAKRFDSLMLGMITNFDAHFFRKSRINDLNKEVAEVNFKEIKEFKNLQLLVLDIMLIKIKNSEVNVFGESPLRKFGAE